jgi:hypothetical protein
LHPNLGIGILPASPGRHAAVRHSAIAHAVKQQHCFVGTRSALVAQYKVSKNGGIIVSVAAFSGGNEEEDIYGSTYGAKFTQICPRRTPTLPAASAAERFTSSRRRLVTFLQERCYGQAPSARTRPRSPCN